MFRGGRLYAIHTDHIGTPRLITDDTNTPVWQWAYSAFGDNAPSGILKPTTAAASAYLSLPPTAGSRTTTATLLAVSAPAQALNLRFPGQYNDSETGWFYNTMRSYLPTQDRYGQNDPIGLRGGWNRSVYANANAVSNTDPIGLQVAVALPGPTMPALTSACLANAALCGPALAGAGGYAVGTLIYPIIEGPIADAIDSCVTSMSGAGRWSCTASCNVTVIDSILDGKVPGRVTGSARGKTEPEACAEAKRAATQSSPRGTYARHCQCSCSKS